jgi:hypothetical protein
MYRLPITSAFEWDVVIVKVHDNLKPLHTLYNNYYHVINRTCDRRQTESRSNLAQTLITASPVFVWLRLNAIAPSQQLRDNNY